jgi:molecular chaperone DnaK
VRDGANEKTATRQAGYLAGLNVLCLIPEPASTALAYGIEQDHNQVVLVYDLGGDTFDITIMAINYGDINIICTDSDPHFGGKEWDSSLVIFFANKFQEATGISANLLLDDQETHQELLDAAERCKRRLSYRKSAVEAICFQDRRIIAEITSGRIF